jgi:hypothetical protein
MSKKVERIFGSVFDRFFGSFSTKCEGELWAGDKNFKN